MAKYDVTYSCGHKGVVVLFGKIKDRDSKIRWMETSGYCPECYKALKKAETEKANSEWSILPEIEGVSEKQISYAKKLRLDVVTSHTNVPFDKLQAKGADFVNSQIPNFKNQLENGDSEFRRNWKYVALLWETNAGKIIDLCK